MRHIEHRAVIFAIAVLYNIEQKWKEKFHTISRFHQRVNIHYGFYRLKKEKLLGEFDFDFDYDPLHGISDALAYVLETASIQLLLIRINGNGCHHLDKTGEVMIADSVRRHTIDEDLVKTAAKRLSELLDEQEVKAPTSVNI